MTENEEGLLYILKLNNQTIEDNVSMEFIMKDNKIIMKENNLIKCIIKSGTDEFKTIEQFLKDN